MQDKIRLGWSEIQLMCEDIANLVKVSGIPIKQVFGLPRGGLIPAVMLSHLLDVPLALTKEQCRTDILIVDDICDSGETLETVTASFEGMRYATAVLVQLPTAKFHPNFIGMAGSANTWIEFPWETEESSKLDRTPIT